MTNVIYYLAASEGGEGLPLEKSVNPLLPASYDVVWSAVSLIVVLFLFWKFVLPKAEAKAALEKYNAQLAEARAEAAQIREEAREKGKQIVADMKAQATEESNRIIESGEKQLQAQREQVVTELRREMGQNSINLAERLLGEQLSDDVKRSGTIDAFLSDLDTVAPAGK